MSEEEKGLSEIVDQLSMLAIMAEPDDVVALGSMLEKLEEVEKITCHETLQPIRLIGCSLKNLLEKIIVQEVPDPASGLQLLKDGVRVMQSKILGPPSNELNKEEEIFWSRIQPLMDAKVDRPNVPEKSSLPQPEGQFDPTQDLSLFNDFVVEGMEHLNTIEVNILKLEQAPEDKECINSIFRPFHTIKGISGFLNLIEINKFAHAMEFLLDDARNRRIQIFREMIDFILEAVDFLKDMILDVKKHLEAGELTQSHFDLDPYLQKIKFFQTGQISQEQTIEKENPEKTEASLPRLGEILCSKAIISPTQLHDALQEQTSGKKDMKIGEILVQKKEAKPKQIIEALREQKKISSPPSDSTVKVDTQKLDNLVDMVGELVIAESLVQQNPMFSSIHDQKLNRDFSQLKRITTDLQKISMSLRMVPIRQTFQKMIRVVRDVAQKAEKQVDLVMSGEETEIDRNMVDKLYDPLVHMIRNSIDHGIEKAERRLEKGKLKTGQIFLRAFQKGGYIIIEVEDDGQGLNRERILKKAREKGLISAENSLTEHEIDNLIFEPGFSTAEKVTDVSGRGVGTDVVKKVIEELKGKIEIFSTDGKGCRFVIRVPLTLAIMDGIVVRIGQERYIIPTIYIKETLRPKAGDLATVQSRGELLKVWNTLLPLIRLYHLLGIIPQQRDPWDGLVIIAESEGKRKCLMVDDLIGKQEVVMKNLGEKLKAIKGVSGATILGDGRVGLILDIPGIFEIDQVA
jgi:two-component system chemotaxis sensor kinase CheA